MSRTWSESRSSPACFLQYLLNGFFAGAIGSEGLKACVTSSTKGAGVPPMRRVYQAPKVLRPVPLVVAEPRPRVVSP